MSQMKNNPRQRRNPTASWMAEQSTPPELPQQEEFDQHHRHPNH
jgi:hypothetical protein